MDNIKTTNRNFFMVNRKLLHSDLWLSEKFCRGKAWVDLLGLANHAEGHIRVRGNRMKINRGQVGYSMEKLRKRWGWSRGKIERWFNELETDKQISKHNNRITSVITLINYEKYQSNRQTDDKTDSKTDAQTDRQLTIRSNNNKEEDNNKEERKKIIPPKLEWVKERIIEKEYKLVDAEEFIDYWDEEDWKRKGKPVKNWHLTLSNLERIRGGSGTAKQSTTAPQKKFYSFKEQDYATAQGYDTDSPLTFAEQEIEIGKALARFPQLRSRPTYIEAARYLKNKNK